MSTEFGWLSKGSRTGVLLNMAQNIHNVWNSTSSRSLTRIFSVGFYLILYTHSVQFVLFLLTLLILPLSVVKKCRFLDPTQRRISVGRTPLDEWSARRRDLYLTACNTYNKQTSMSLAGLEPAILAGERPLGPAAYFQLLTVAESRRSAKTRLYAVVRIKLLCAFSIALGLINLPSITS